MERKAGSWKHSACFCAAGVLVAWSPPDSPAAPFLCSNVCLVFPLYNWVPLVKRWMIQEWENSTLRSAARSWTTSDTRQDSTHRYSFIPVQVQSASVACLEHKGALKFLPLVAGGFSRLRSISGSVSEHLSVLPGFPLSFLFAWGTPRTSVQLLSVAVEFVRIYFCSCVRWHSCWWN